MKQLFEEIQKQSEFIFFYKDSQVDLNKSVNIDLEKASVQQVLEQALVNTNLGYEIFDRQIVILPEKKQTDPKEKSESSLLEQPQKKSISGHVTDSSGGPLPGVSVVVKGTTTGTITDSEGNFSLQVSTDANTLSFSFVGMKSEEKSIAGATFFNIVLQDATVGIEEVVAIGYGDLSNRRISSSLTSIKANQLKDAATPTMEQAIIGKIPGMQIKQVSGQPGSSSSIRIRGDASISTNNSPLYVIDGFPMNFGYSETQSPLQMINPNDIESITILKDAASTSIYGSRASNGVVVIKTKSGEIGKSELTFNYSSSLQTYHPHSKIKVLNGQQFAQYAIDHIEDPMRANGIPIPADKSDIPADYRNPEAIGKGTDWFEEIMQIAPCHNYDMTFTSGNEKVKSFISAGYVTQDGIIKYTGYERLTARANIQIVLNKYINGGISIAPSYSWGRKAPTGGPTWYNQSIMSSVYQASPVVSPYDANGKLRPYIQSSGTFGYPNPLHVLQNIDDLDKDFVTLLNGYLQADLKNGIVLKTSGNLSYDGYKNDYFKSSEVRNWNGGDHPNDAISRITNNTSIKWVLENTLNYSKKIADKHYIDMVLGYTAEKDVMESFYAEGVKFPNDIVRTVQSGINHNVNSSRYDQSLLSYLGRINYSYNDKYLASVTMRRDGSSRFGANRKWGNFPSASLGWRVSSEEFMENVTLINDLKLRTSYGLTGNKEIGDYLYVSAMSRSDYVLNDELRPGQIVAGFENPDLGWESSRQFDMGMDISFLNNIFTLTVDYYKKITENMLMNIPISTASGYSSAWMNLGKMENKGMEYSLNAKNKIGKLSIETDLNVYFNRNTVLATNRSNDPIFGSDQWTITTVGFPISSFYGQVSDGVFKNQAEFDQGPHYTNAGQEGVGGPRYLDTDGDGIDRDGVDDVIIGTPEPICSYGFSSRLAYKDFDFSFVFNGQLGGQIFSGTNTWYFLLEGPLVNNSVEVLDRWRTPENTGNGVIPVASAASVRFRHSNDTFLQDNTYLWLRNVTLGYTLPKSLLNKQNVIKNARFYFTALNTFLLSKNKWGMPEANQGGSDGNQGGVGNDSSINEGVDHNSYPIPMSFTIGANIKF